MRSPHTFAPALKQQQQGHSEIRKRFNDRLDDARLEGMSAQGLEQMRRLIFG